MAHEWLSYIQAGERLGISAEAVRQKAIRNRWPRRPGNDGRAQVHVDVDEVIASTVPRQPPVDHPADDSPTPEQPPVEPLADTRMLDALDNHINTLKQIVDRLEESLSTEQARTDAERARADAERGRGDRLTVELADLAKRFTTATDDARSREATLAEQLATTKTDTALLQVRLDAAQVEMAAIRARPWWRRLAG